MYLDDCLEVPFLCELTSFITKYSFLFDTNNTHFFADRVWEKIPQEVLFCAFQNAGWSRLNIQ